MFARYFAQLLLGVKRDKGLSHERGMWILKRDRYASFSHTLFPFLYRVAFLLSSLSLFLFYTSGFPCSPCITSSFPLPPPLPVSRPVSPLETLSIFLSLFRERPRSRNVRVAFVVTANIVGERVREDVDHTSRIRSNQFDPFPARGGEGASGSTSPGLYTPRRFYERGASEEIATLCILSFCFLASIFEGYDAPFVSPR